MATKRVSRFGRPKQIPARLWREWADDQRWKREIVAFLGGFMGQEFTCVQIRRCTDLAIPVLTERLVALKRRIDRSNATVELVWRQDGNTVLWRIQERKNSQE